MALIHRLNFQRKFYPIATVFSVILPAEDIILALGGTVIVLATILIILKGHRKKKSAEKLDKRVTGIKRQFNEIKGESINYVEDDWLEMRLKDDSDKYKRQLGMNKK